METEPFRISSMIPTFISAFFTFVFGVIGVVIGAGLQQPYAIQLEEQKNLLGLRKDAYTDFFKGQADLQLYDGNKAKYGKDYADQLNKEYEALVSKARFHIAVYGSKLTVETLASYYEKYDKTSQNCYDPEKFRDDTNIYVRMREENLGAREENRVALEKLTLLIHHCRLPK